MQMGTSEIQPPMDSAEKKLMSFECRWNVYDINLCKQIGLTDFDGNPDWAQFQTFLKALERRPFAEKELNAERMGTQVRKSAGIPTALVPHVWRCPARRCRQTFAVRRAIAQETCRALPCGAVDLLRCRGQLC